MAKVLKRAFFEQDTRAVAQQLLGKLFCIRTAGKILKFRIIETEAYLGTEDPACHSYNGRRTQRNEVMYWEAGHAYVYFIYGMYFCFNIVTQKPNDPQAVLIRALEPLSTRKSPKTFSSRTLLHTNGPGKLCRYLGITRAQNGLDLTQRKSIWIEDPGDTQTFKVIKSARVGIDYAGEAAAWKLRYFIKGHPYVSRK